MLKTPISTKRIAISKANAQTVIIVAVASFVTVFCLVATKAVIAQNSYQSKVTSAKETAHRQLDKNIKAFGNLVTSYQSFDGNATNVLSGSRTGSGDNDGSNSKLVLDALPSSYDFPALASSLEKILSNQPYKVTGITGTDDQLAQQANNSSGSPQPVEMPFSFAISSASYDSIDKLIAKLGTSIRPIQIDSIAISGGGSDMTLNVEAHTYYQPGKTVKIDSKVVK